MGGGCLYFWSHIHTIDLLHRSPKATRIKWAGEKNMADIYQSQFAACRCNDKQIIKRIRSSNAETFKPVKGIHERHFMMQWLTNEWGWWRGRINFRKNNNKKGFPFRLFYIYIVFIYLFTFLQLTLHSVSVCFQQNGWDYNIKGTIWKIF